MDLQNILTLMIEFEVSGVESKLLDSHRSKAAHLRNICMLRAAMKR